ncbi:MAG: metal ABC transporter substrate-binding protein [Gammaproteobacteria bacterium]
MGIIRRLLILALFWPALAQATLDIVATSSSTGMLVREIAAEHAKLEILAPPDRDLHYLQARPSMMRALRSADLVVALGAELEVGWLPVAIQQAANPKILPGQPGYFEAAAHVDRLDVGTPADRALGDVHPMGNPHINMDPVRMAEVGKALAERLAELDPANAADYRRRAGAFETKVDQRLAGWQNRTGSVQGAVSFHKDVTYLLDRFGVTPLGTLEPVAGVPPTASHIKELIDGLSGQKGVVLFTVYQPERAPAALAEALGWPMVRLPLEPPLGADGDGYLEHIDTWVEALAKGR